MNMDPFAALAQAAYVSIESYRRDGSAVRTPVWITAEGGQLFCWTLANSGKVKRIRNNPRVRLARCQANGRIQGEWIEAIGQVQDSREDVKNQARRMRAKYGLKFQPFRLLSLLRRTRAVAIEFRPV